MAPERHPRPPHDVVGELWFAHDMARFARGVGALFVLGGAAVLWLTTQQAPPAGMPEWLLVTLGTLPIALGVTLWRKARTHPDLAVPLALAALGVVMTCRRQDAWAVALGAMTAGAVFWLWRGRMRRARALARQNPDLQAARALSGQPARRDPHAP